MGDRPDYFYTQSAVVPFRTRGEQLEILMISSRKRRRWVIPKGIKEPELSALDSAAKEAMEEAGVCGKVLPQPLGTYQYPKWGGTCSVEVFAMQVEQMHDEWEESYRDREWVSLEEAVSRSEDPGLKQILRNLAGRLGPSC